MCRSRSTEPVNMLPFLTKGAWQVPFSQGPWDEQTSPDYPGKTAELKAAKLVLAVGCGRCDCESRFGAGFDIALEMGRVG